MKETRAFALSPDQFQASLRPRPGQDLMQIWVLERFDDLESQFGYTRKVYTRVTRDDPGIPKMKKGIDKLPWLLKT